MLINELMTNDVAGVSLDTLIQECAQKMRDLNVGALIVYERDKAIGMLTDRDICCRAVAEEWDLSDMTAEEVMSEDVNWCFEDQDCEEAAQTMEDKHIRRIAVMNRESEMVGVLSVGDLARISHGLAGEVLEATSYH